MVENDDKKTVIYSQLETSCEVVIGYAEKARTAEAWIALSLLIDEVAASPETSKGFAASIMSRVAVVRKLREDDLAEQAGFTE